MARSMLMTSMSTAPKSAPESAPDMDGTGLLGGTASTAVSTVRDRFVVVSQGLSNNG